MQFAAPHNAALSMSWTHESSSSGEVSCFAASPSGSWLAAGMASAVLLFSAESKSGSPAARLSAAACTALCFSSDSTILATVSGNDMRCWSVDPARETAAASLPQAALEDDDESGTTMTVSCITPLDHKRFAVGSARSVIVMSTECIQLHSLGPCRSPVHALQWSPSSESLYIQAGGKLFRWGSGSSGGSEELAELLCGVATTMCMSAKGSYLAAGIHASSTAQVCIWAQSDQPPLPSTARADPGIRFDCSVSEICCMAWDGEEAFLAASDGAEATVWEVGRAGEGRSVQLVVCCGHSPRSHITHMTFQPTGSYLATAASDGRVLLFDTAPFRGGGGGGGSGGVASPAAAQQVAAPGAAFAGLHWLAGGELVAAVAGGITALHLSAAAAEEPAQDAAADAASKASAPLVLPTTPGISELQAHNLARMDSDVAAKHGARRLLATPLKIAMDGSRRVKAGRELTGGAASAGLAASAPAALPASRVATSAPPRVVLERKSVEASTLSPHTPKFTPAVARGSTTSADAAARPAAAASAACAAGGAGGGRAGPCENCAAMHDSVSSSMSRKASLESASSAPRAGSAAISVKLPRPADPASTGNGARPAPPTTPTVTLARVRTEAAGVQASPPATSGGPSSAGPFHSRGADQQRSRASMDGGHGRGQASSLPANGAARSGQWAAAPGQAPLARTGSLGRHGTRDSAGVAGGGAQEGAALGGRQSALSPGLLQHIQAVKENPHTGVHPPQRSDLAGWGPGPLPPMPNSPAAGHHLQYMMPYGQPSGQVGQVPPPVFLQAGPSPVGGPYGFYPAMLPQQMSSPHMHQVGVAGHGMPPSPGRSSQPGTPTGRAPPPPGPPPPGPPGSLSALGALGHPPADVLGGGGTAAGAPMPGAPPMPGPMVYVPAGAQPPQGWAPVMAPHQGWMGIYPGGPPPPYLAPLGGHLGPPPQAPFLQPYHLQPPQPPRMHLEEALGGLTLRPHLRASVGFRSAPASLARDQVTRAAASGAVPPSSGSAHRSGSADTMPSVIREGKEGVGSSDAGSTTGDLAEGLNCAPIARPAGGVAGFEGFCVRDGLLVAEGTGEGDPPHAVTTLYVGNLPPLVDEYVLMTTFQFFGQITNIQVIRDKSSSQSRGFAFVTYAHPGAATNAQAYMNGMALYGAFGGRAVRVGPSNRA